MLGWLRDWMGLQLWSTPIQRHERVLEVAKRKGNKKAEAKAYLDLGKAYEENGEPAKAKRCFNNALKIAKDQRDLEQEKNAYDGLAFASIFCNEFLLAFEYLDKATDIELNIYYNQNPSKLQDEVMIEKLSTSDANKRCSTTVGDVETLHEKKDSRSQKPSSAQIAVQRSGLNLALELMKRLYDFYRFEVKWESSDHLDLLRVEASTGLGSAWFRLGDSEKAIKSFQKARRNVKKESANEAELLNITEETCNFTDAERLPTEGLASLEKHFEEFSASNIYAVPASSEEPLTENDRKTMTENVKSLARKNLLCPSNEDSSSENDVKFVSADEQIYNLARDDLLKNKSTKIPAIKMQDLLSSYMGSVGQISCGEIRGTCFLVTDKVVITNYHVYRMFMEERRKNPALQLPITVTFDYFYHGQAENYVCVDVDERGDLNACESGSLDYKFLSLRESEGLRGRVPLGPLVSGRPLAEGLVIILGHPAGSEMFEETCVVVRSWEERVKHRHDKLRATPDVHIANIDSLHNLRDKHRGRLSYDTTLFCGSSGSPVFTLNGDIVAMHTQGYTLNFREGKCALMEFGVQFNAICEDFRFRCGQNLLEQFFPNLNHESYNQQPAVCGNDDGQNKAIRLEKTLHVFETKADNHLSRGIFYEKAIESTEEAEKLAAKVNNSETKQEQMQEIESWFEKTFLDSKQQLKDEIDEELESFPWFGGSYGLAAPNKKIPRLHLFLTVKRGTTKTDVRRELEKKYERDPKKYFELLQEPKRKPKIKFLGNGVNEASPQASAASSDLPSPGGSVLACIPGSPNPCHLPEEFADRENPCHLPEKDDKDDSHEIKGEGTLTLFCFSNGHHYALTCFHVGCANDEMCLNATFNKVENIWKIRSSFTNYEFLAKERTYRFRRGGVNNNDDQEAIAFGPDDSSHSPLGDFHDFRFDHNCDILSLKISNDVEVDCKIEDATSREWKSIWDELLGKFKERTGPIEVGKHQLSSSLTDGHIVSCDAKVPSYGKNKNIFRHAIVVKGCNGPFLKDGDSGSLVFFRSKNKQPFAYGVCKVDDHIVLPGHQTCSVDSDSDSDTSSIWSEDDSSNRTGSASESEGVPTETADENASTVESDDDSDSFEVEFRAEAKDTETYFICLRLDTALENLGLHGAACVGSCGRSRQIESHE